MGFVRLLGYQGYSRLIFLSCIEKPRNKMEITREWGLSENSKPLHRKSVNEEIENLQSSKYIEKKDGELKSRLDQPEKGFTKHLESMLSEETQNLPNNDKIDLATPLYANAYLFSKLLDKKWLRLSLFDIDRLKEYFDYDSEQWEKIGIDIVRQNFGALFIDIYMEIILHELNERAKVVDNGSTTSTEFTQGLCELTECIIDSYRSMGNNNPECLREPIRNQLKTHSNDEDYVKFKKRVLYPAVPFLRLETDWEEEAKRLQTEG